MIAGGGGGGGGGFLHFGGIFQQLTNGVGPYTAAAGGPAAGQTKGTGGKGGGVAGGAGGIGAPVGGSPGDNGGLYDWSTGASLTTGADVVVVGGPGGAGGFTGAQGGAGAQTGGGVLGIGNIDVGQDTFKGGAGAASSGTGGFGGPEGTGGFGGGGGAGRFGGGGGGGYGGGGGGQGSAGIGATGGGGGGTSGGGSILSGLGGEYSQVHFANGGGGGSLVNSAYGVEEKGGVQSGAGSVYIVYASGPPSITGTAGITYTSPGATSAPFAGVTIGDPNPESPTDSLTITLSDTKASLAVGTAVSGVTFSNPSAGVYTLVGSAGGVTSELAALTLTAPSTVTGANGVEALTLSLSLSSSASPLGPVSGSVKAEILAPNFTDLTTSYSGAIQTFTVQTTGYYQISADGAQGGAGDYGSSSGGLGAMASGEIYLQAGAQLEIVAGGAGAPRTR